MDLNVLIAIVTALGSVALVLWHGGRQVGRVESAITRLLGIETVTKETASTVQKHEVKLGILENSFSALRSDHRELKSKVDSTKEDTAAIRGKLESFHGE